MLQQILTNYVLPLLIYGAITGLANLLLSHKSQIESYAESYPKWAGVLKMLRAVSFDPWSAIAAISLWAKGRLPAAQQNGAKALAARVARANAVAPSNPPSSPNWPTAAALLLLCCFSLHSTACAAFGSGGSFWPKVEACAPSPQDLVNMVAAALLAGGDYESALEQIAEQDGAAAVECAVQVFVSLIGASESDSSLAAKARGREFLAKVKAGK